MKLKDIYNQYKGNVFEEVLSDEILINETEEWEYHSSVSLNGIIAIGWFANDDLLIINGDGIFIFDILDKEFVLRDFESSFKKYISDDNLTFFVESRSEIVSIFGLRGGGGNLLTKDNIWGLALIEIAWNIKVPKLSNYKMGKEYFLELQQNDYEGYMYLGFSKLEKYFAIMGDSGLDIFLKKNK